MNDSFFNPSHSDNHHAYVQSMQEDRAFWGNVKASYDAGSSIIQQDIHRLTWEEKLQRRDILLNKEVAYSSIEDHGGGLTVSGSDGLLRQLYKVSISEILYIYLDPLFEQESYYIAMANNGRSITIPEAVINHDKRLLNAMAALLGNPVKFFTTRKRTADLLRQYIVSNAKLVPYGFYSGWDCRNNSWKFLLRGSSTHSPKLPSVSCEVSLEEEVGESSRANTLIAATRVANMFWRMHPDARSVLFLWYHLAPVYTILQNMGLVPAMGLCVFSQGALTSLSLEKIFCWFGDNVVSLGSTRSNLCKMLVDRKDEAIVLNDRFIQAGNCELVQNIVAEGQIPLSRREGVYTPLRGPVMLLSNGASPLCNSSNFFTIEMDDMCWSDYDPSTISALSGYTADYLRGFLSYVEGHIDDLQRDILAGNSGVDEYDLEDLTSEAFTTFTTLRGLRKFLLGWQSYLALEESQAEPWNDALAVNDNFLVRILSEASTSGDDMASIFISVSKRMVCTGKLSKHYINHVPDLDSLNETTEGTIFTDDTCWYFDRKAFASVAHQCGAGAVMMARSLDDNRLLKGARASAKTYMTRISVHDEDGYIMVARVYALDKALFEDPFSTFDEEVLG